jgi:class 3 adenylate cyclase
VWGDAVNTASRMESASEAGRVNVSGDTYRLVQEKFYCMYRGQIEAKNKGEVDMYYVTAPKV